MPTGHFRVVEYGWTMMNLPFMMKELLKNREPRFFFHFWGVLGYMSFTPKNSLSRPKMVVHDSFTLIHACFTLDVFWIFLVLAHTPSVWTHFDICALVFSAWPRKIKKMVMTDFVELWQPHLSLSSVIRVWPAERLHEFVNLAQCLNYPAMVAGDSQFIQI